MKDISKLGIRDPRGLNIEVDRTKLVEAVNKNLEILQERKARGEAVDSDIEKLKAYKDTL
jgi:hypothetical protein